MDIGMVMSARLYIVCSSSKSQLLRVLGCGRAGVEKD